MPFDPHGPNLGPRPNHPQDPSADAAALAGAAVKLRPRPRPGGRRTRVLGLEAGLGVLLLGLCWAGWAWAGASLVIAGPGGSLVLPLPSQGFTLSWEHSVEHTQWRETFVAGPGGRWELVSSEFASAGAGLPDRLEPGDVFSLRNGRMKLTHHHVALPALRLRLSDVSPHRLSVGGRILDLNAIFGEGVVTIRAATNSEEGSDEKN